MDADQVHRLAVELAAEGSAESPEDADPAVWSRDAEEAALRLGRQIETVESITGGVHAALADWPRTPEEQQVHEAALRRSAIAAWVRTSPLDDALGQDDAADPSLAALADDAR